MARIDEKHVGVARVYGLAALRLAEKQGVTEDFLEELGEVVSLVEKDSGFADFVENPLIDPGDRKQSLETMFRGKASDLLVDTLQVLNRNGRLLVLPTLYELCRREQQARRGRVEVRVATAVPLNDPLRTKLHDALKKHTGKEADLIEEVDPTLVGGLIVRVGDEKLDGSVRRSIDMISSMLHERGGQEILKRRHADD